MYLDGAKQKIIDWVKEGLSDRVIAERLRVSTSTVRYWRERNGVSRPPRNAEKLSTGSTEDSSGD
jgi:transposase-like protein